MSDFQTQQRRRNIVVGGFVLLALAAFVWMLVKFRNLPLFAAQFRSFMVFVQFPDAPGVNKDTPVLYCGYQVGRVAAVDPPTLVADELGRPYHSVRVTIAIENRYAGEIPDHADIRIVKRGLGSSYIEITVNPEKPAEGYLAMGLTKYGEVSTASEFFPPTVQNKLENLVDSIALLSQNANTIIGDPDNQVNIKLTLEHVAKAAAKATDTLESIRQLTDLGTERLDATAERLDETLMSFQRFSEVGTEQIESAANRLDETLASFQHFPMSEPNRLRLLRQSEQCDSGIHVVLAKIHTGTVRPQSLSTMGDFTKTCWTAVKSWKCRSNRSNNGPPRHAKGYSHQVVKLECWVDFSIGLLREQMPPDLCTALGDDLESFCEKEHILGNLCEKFHE